MMPTNALDIVVSTLTLTQREKGLLGESLNECLIVPPLEHARTEYDGIAVSEGCKTFLC